MSRFYVTGRTSDECEGCEFHRKVRVRYSDCDGEPVYLYDCDNIDYVLIPAAYNLCKREEHKNKALT